MKIFIANLLFLACVMSANGFQLRTDPTNSCRAYGNATTYDISKVMDWPVKLQGGGYEFIFDPCTGVPCPGQQGNNIAVCQAADIHWPCGTTNGTIWMMSYVSYTQWKILYPNGVNFRATVVTFTVDSNATKTTIKALPEENLLYNFEIKGKCLGQPFSPAECNN